MSVMPVNSEVWCAFSKGDIQIPGRVRQENVKIHSCSAWKGTV